MKRLAKLFLAVVLAFSFALTFVGCGDSDSAQNEKGLLVKVFKGDEYYTVYGYNDDGETSVLDIGKYFTAESGKTIGRISANAFSGNSSLKEIIVPDTVCEIDAGAFSGMKSLEKITLPFVGAYPVSDAYYNQNASDKKAIDAERTFGYIFGTEEYEGGAKITCNDGKNSADYYIPTTLTEVTVKGSAKVIPMYAFYGVTQITTVNIEGVEDIGEYAFAECATLEIVNLPASLKNIYKNAFECCESLKAYNETTKKGLHFADGTALDFIGDDIISNTKITSVKLSVKELSEKAFAKTGLKNVELTNVEKIGAWAFYGCKDMVVTDIMINGDNIKHFPDIIRSAYEGCIIPE